MCVSTCIHLFMHYIYIFISTKTTNDDMNWYYLHFVVFLPSGIVLADHHCTGIILIVVPRGFDDGNIETVHPCGLALLSCLLVCCRVSFFSTFLFQAQSCFHFKNDIYIQKNSIHFTFLVKLIFCSNFQCRFFHLKNVIEFCLTMQ